MLYRCLSFLTVLFLISCGGGGKNNPVEKNSDIEAPFVLSSLASGEYSGPQLLSISCEDGAGSGCDRILFRLSEGMLSNDWFAYSEKLSIKNTTTIEFTAYDKAGNQADIQTVSLTINPSENIDPAANVKNTQLPVVISRPRSVPRVKVSLPSGAYKIPMLSVLRCETAVQSSCQIYYTLDGSLPTLRSSRLTGPLYITRSQTIRYFAVDQLGNRSFPESRHYLIDRQPPQLSINQESGMFNRTITVSLVCDDLTGGSGCKQIFYTLDGSYPTSLSQTYSGPIQIADNTRFRAVAIDMVGNSSVVKDRNFTFDYVPPSVASSFPEKGATLFSSKETLLVEMSEPLDLATVNSNNIKLINQSGFEESVNISVVSKTIVVNTQGSLNKGQRYSLQLSGVNDLASNVMPDYNIEFSTSLAYMQVSKHYAFDSSPLEIVEHIYDSNLSYSGSTNFSAPGVDGLWFTSDDVVSSRSTMVFDVATGKPLQMIRYNSPGADSIWNTADDQIGQYTQYEYLNNLLLSAQYFQSAGVDGVWFTTDDLPSQVTRYEYDQQSMLSTAKQYDNSGIDGVWLTADDVMNAYQTFSYDASTIKRITYDGVGKDGMWLNNDDTVAGYTVFEKDTLRQKIVARVVSSAGVDKVWFNEDDPIQTQSTIDLPDVEGFNPLFYP